LFAVKKEDCVRNVYVLRHFETKQTDLFEVSWKDKMGSWVCSISVGRVVGGVGIFLKSVKAYRDAAVRVLNCLSKETSCCVVRECDKKWTGILKFNIAN